MNKDNYNQQSSSDLLEAGEIFRKGMEELLVSILMLIEEILKMTQFASEANEKDKLVENLHFLQLMNKQINEKLEAEQLDEIKFSIMAMTTALMIYRNGSTSDPLKENLMTYRKMKNTEIKKVLGVK